MRKYDYDQLIKEGYKIENAVIKDVDLSMADHGCLTLAMTLDGGGWSVVYGGYRLLEINLLGIREGRHYPNRFFWEMAAEEGCEVILGCDAHTPQSLNDPKAERDALAMAKEFDLKVLETATLRPIR